MNQLELENNAKEQEQWAKAAEKQAMKFKEDAKGAEARINSKKIS